MLSLITGTTEYFNKNTVQTTAETMKIDNMIETIREVVVSYVFAVK